MSGIDANIVLYDLYETNYGIYNHINAVKQKPLASVALHETEDNTTTSALYEAIETYHNKGIKELFGLSIKEYLDLPNEICIKLMEVANKNTQKNNTILSSIEKDMQQTKKNM